MTPNLRLVTDSPEAYPHVFPAKGIGNALPKARLAGPGRAGEEKDRALLLLFQLHDREVLDDPLLDFFKARMVGVKDFTGCGNINTRLFGGHPGQFEQGVQVIPDHGALVVLAAACLELPSVCQGLLPDLFGHTGLLDPFPVSPVPLTLFILFVEFFLDDLQLLAEHSLPV
ncbi:MAG: hypothetical protein A4E38_01678 [Methanoregulaceae archaeon PtaB.Bin108]|nr:MAG: hypothetical protein A4E38_01678 [Methanoregulaceae archaeon PtaB.Bin108]